MKNTYFILPALLFTLIITGCSKTPKCEEHFNVNQSEIVVAFKDQATGKYLYSEVNPLYNKDSLKVFEPNGNSFIISSGLNQIPNTSNRYWDLSFGNIYNQSTDANSFDSEICKNYIVKYKHNETDTIKACFKAKKTECGSVFETLKVYYKGQLVGSVTNTTIIAITINKNYQLLFYFFSSSYSKLFFGRKEIQ